MDFPVEVLLPNAYPLSLREIPHVPEQLFIRGTPVDKSRRLVCFVGARRHSHYGAEACKKIVSALAPYPVAIVSGLAIGIDAIAHRAALDAGLPTIGVVGSGLDDTVLYPRSNRSLAGDILRNGGTLISELEPMTRAQKHVFPSRNRIMAGLSELVIAIECGERSGTRITTGLAVEYNKTVGAVPHSIFSDVGAGSNALIHQGAHVVRSADDVVHLLGMDTVDTSVSEPDTSTLTDEEKSVYDALAKPTAKTVLAGEVAMPMHALQVVLTKLEMKGLVSEISGIVQRQ